MSNRYGKAQYKVTWPGKEFLIYANDPEDAKVQVNAPEDAKVEESYLSKKDIERILTKRG